MTLGPGHPSVEIQIVRLVGGSYSKPAGTLGYVESTLRNECVWVRWVGGTGSGPIDIADLEDVGMLFVAIPQHQSSSPSDLWPENVLRTGGYGGMGG